MAKYAVIMAGGIGTRFWPVSRVRKPKQFLDILGLGKTLLQMTYERFLNVVPKENIFIVTNEQYRALIKEQLPAITDNQILGEPIAKNTAPCIAYAAFKIFSKDPKAVMVVAPSDHLIVDEANFVKRVNEGVDFVKDKKALLTLGIKPSRPDTGYGYIQFVEKEEQKNIFNVKTFTEKPNEELAMEFIGSGDFLWNAGIFIWSVESIMSAFEEHLTELSELFKGGTKHFNKSSERSFIEEVYPVCQSISIDYGIIEKADNVYVIPSDFGWSDLGTWKSLYDVVDKTTEGNVLLGDSIELNDTTNSLVFNQNGKLIVLEGVNDLFVLDTKDALLICHFDKEQEVKRVVGEIKSRHKGKFI
ncbi:MAG: mannose-1-phosphate guanylyltransferase [Bacteroidia bacterium]|jgi:mannose-1-phosphate guanylyltransferase